MGKIDKNLPQKAIDMKAIKSITLNGKPLKMCVLGGGMMWQAKRYEELEYVESRSKTRVDIDFREAGWFDFDFAFWTGGFHPTGTWVQTWSNYLSEEHKVSRLLFNGQTAYFYNDSRAQDGAQLMLQCTANRIHTVEMRRDSLKYDNQRYTLISPQNAPDSNAVYRLMTYDFLGSIPNADIPHRIYYFRISKNGIVLRDLVAARRVSDGEVGFYDRVSEQFFGNTVEGTSLIGGSPTGRWY